MGSRLHYKENALSSHSKTGNIVWRISYGKKEKEREVGRPSSPREEGEIARFSGFLFYSRCLRKNVCREWMKSLMSRAW